MEKLALARRGVADDGRNRLTGRIGEAIYLGSGSKYEVDLADGSKAIVRSTLEAASFPSATRSMCCSPAPT